MLLDVPHCMIFGVVLIFQNCIDAFLISLDHNHSEESDEIREYFLNLVLTLFHWLLSKMHNNYLLG